MSTLINASLSPEEQLKQLEDYYAQCLADDVEPKVLSDLWKNIKVIRQQLNEPIYNYVTPKNYGNSFSLILALALP